MAFLPGRQGLTVSCFRIFHVFLTICVRVSVTILRRTIQFLPFFARLGVHIPPENIDVPRGRFGKNAVVSIPAATVSKRVNAATLRDSTDLMQPSRRKIAKPSG